jgi:hypothetical protein
VLHGVRGHEHVAERVADVVAHDGEDPLSKSRARASCSSLWCSTASCALRRSWTSTQLPMKPANAPESSEKGTPRSKIQRNLAVVPAQPVFHLERLAPLEVVEVVGHAALEVLLVDAFGPAVPHLLLEAGPVKSSQVWLK